MILNNMWFENPIGKLCFTSLSRVKFFIKVNENRRLGRLDLFPMQQTLQQTVEAIQVFFVQCDMTTVFHFSIYITLSIIKV